MDSLLHLGPRDDRLLKLFSKLGYDVRSGDSSSSIKELLSGGLLDLIIVDSRLDAGALDLLEYLRTDALTKQTPIVYLTGAPTDAELLKKAGIQDVELMPLPVTPGLLAGRVATQLRLRKMKGADSEEASLAEVNAALRDLNQKMVKEREEARNIQQSLLPEALPADPRYELSASYDPLEEVGGDWYYAQKTASGKLSLLIADVTGHGISAAFIGAMTKLALTASNQEEPAKLLTAMNTLMVPQLPPGRFVTMDAALFDPATGELRVSLGGHPPVFVVKFGSRSAVKLGARGFAVGFMADSEFNEESLTLEVGDVAVLVTDGITEAQNRAGKMYGHERLCEMILQAGVDVQAPQLVNSILEDLNSFCEGRILKDDVTVVLLKRRG